MTHKMLLFLLSAVWVRVSLSLRSSPSYLSSGFLQVNLSSTSSSSSSLTFQVHDFLSVPVSLKSFRLKGVPGYADVESRVFTLLYEDHESNKNEAEGKKVKQVNDKNVYYDGNQYYLFFLENAEPYGTWLLGNRLGVDSGLAYIRPETHSVVPLHLESAKTSWHFLQAGKWTPESDVWVEPVDGEVIEHVEYNTISYFHDGTLSASVLLMNTNIMAANRSSHNAADVHFVKNLKLSAPPIDMKDKTHALFWNLETEEWLSFSTKYFIPRGSPFLLTESRKTRRVHLVGDESAEDGWRIFLRENGRDEGSALETQLYLNNAGVPSKYTIKPLKQKSVTSVLSKLNDKVSNAQVGSYYWLWFESQPSVLGENEYFAVVQENFILKCISRSANNNKIVFEYHHSNRRVAMDRSLLSLATSVVVATWNADIDQFEWSLDGSPLIAKALFALNPDPITWLRDYLISHENFLAPGLSSCFMYHSGMSMPEQLIYAAEFICVLIGSKPITMIQYTSTSDHQWKFPLIPELTRAVVSGRSIYESLSTAIDVQINTYQVTSETAIFYRSSRKQLLDLIVPNGTAQALHIVPFPSEAGEDPHRMDVVLRAQIYNSYWNGYLLGYPVRFIESYLLTFHTSLQQHAIVEEMRRAERDVSLYFKEHKELQRVEIKYGLDVDLLNDSSILQHLTRFLV